MFAFNATEKCQMAPPGNPQQNLYVSNGYKCFVGVGWKGAKIIKQNVTMDL